MATEPKYHHINAYKLSIERNIKRPILQDYDADCIGYYIGKTRLNLTLILIVLANNIQYEEYPRQ